MASSTGGVSNIRAMFEAKQQEMSSSPPSRGRSPAAMSDINSIRSSSSRPVSKIRTSFVAVEKSGQMGGPILGLRRISDVQNQAVIDGDVKPEITRKTSHTGGASVAEEKGIEKEANAKNGVTKADASITNSKEVETQANGAPRDDEGVSTSKGKATEVKKQIPATIKTQTKSESDRNFTAKATSSPKLKKQPNSPKEVPVRSKTDVRKPAALDTKASTSSLRNATNQPSKPTSTKVKTPTTATNASKPLLKRDVPSKPGFRISTPRTSIAPNDTKANKNVKPTPKSPTRPVRLPAAATASTASSAAKTTTDRPTSQTSIKPRTSTDGNFLARMMRPTTASASKTHEKATTKTTPQKVAATRPKRVSEATEKSVASKSNVPEGKSGILLPDTIVATHGTGSQSRDEPKLTTGMATSQQKLPEIHGDEHKGVIPSESAKDQVIEVSAVISESSPEESSVHKIVDTQKPPNRGSEEPVESVQPEKDSKSETSKQSDNSEPKQHTSIDNNVDARTDKDNVDIPASSIDGIQGEATQKSGVLVMKDEADNSGMNGPVIVEKTKDTALIDQKPASDELSPQAVKEPEKDVKTSLATDESTIFKKPENDTKPAPAKAEAESKDENTKETY